MFLRRLLLLVALTPTCGAVTIYVDATAGDDSWTGLCEIWDGDQCGPKQTIQAALDIALSEDVIQVADGTYTGPGNRNLVLSQTTVTVRSKNGPASCTIDCEHVARAFLVSSAQPSGPVIEGFTIMNGLADDPTGPDDNGGAISCEFADPTIRDCILTGNAASGAGGGLYCNGSHPLVRDCQITGNTSAGNGGGVYGYVSRVRIVNCTIAENTAAGSGGGVFLFSNRPAITNSRITGNTVANRGGGVYCGNGSSVTLTNCVITGNDADIGGGVQLHDSFSVLTNCTISGNRAGANGGGVSADVFGGSRAENCVLWANEAPLGPEISVDTYATLTVSYTDAEGGPSAAHVDLTASLAWEAGNIDGDPLFAAPGYWDDPGTPADPLDDVWVDGDYHILTSSPCIDAAENAAVPPDQHDLDDDGDIAELLPLDYDGTPRFTDDPDTDDTGAGTPPIVDMGALEFHADCNDNGVPDYQDIVDGTAEDLNENTVLDECEPMLMLDCASGCAADTLEVAIAISNTEEVIVGGQFFLAYDTSRLLFVSIEPGSSGPLDDYNPFDREIHEFVDETAGHVDYVVGIADGAAGTADDVTAAIITFAVLAEDCAVADLVTFREHYPVTRLSGELGHPVTPDPVDLPEITLDGTPPELTVPPDVDVPYGEPTDPSATGEATATDNCDPAVVVTYVDEVQGVHILRTWTATDACGNFADGVQAITLLPCEPPGDLDCDGVVDINDFHLFIACLNGPDVTTPPPGCDALQFDRADLSRDGDVDLADFADFQVLYAGGG